MQREHDDDRDERTEIQTGADVAAFLRAQHARIRRLFGQVLETGGMPRERAFEELRVLLAVHEAAEEILYPADLEVEDAGDPASDARRSEESALASALAELEALDARSPQFETNLRTLRLATLAHMEAEEQTELATLARRPRTLDDASLARMRKAVQLAEAVAPARPRPGLEWATENLVLGTFEWMVERARNVLL
jgi:hypothetical protein